MPLYPPASGIRCYMSVEALVALSKSFDNIQWWRDLGLTSDHTLPDIADLIPKKDMPNPSKDRDSLRKDLEHVPALVQAATLHAIRLAIRSAEAIAVSWRSVEGEGDVIVTVDDKKVDISLGIHCVTHKP